MLERLKIKLKCIELQSRIRHIDKRLAKGKIKISERKRLESDKFIYSMAILGCKGTLTK